MNEVSIASNIEKVLIQGDLAFLNPDERVQYYNLVCRSVGLNPMTKPFDYIKLNGKLTLYARRDCTDQLRKLNGVSVEVSAREKIGDIYVVTAKATDRNGRSDEATGAVHIGNLRGESLANAFMKAETKAKRRVTLSLCGLGILDETEVDHVERKNKKAEEVQQLLEVDLPEEPVDAEIIERNQVIESHRQEPRSEAPICCDRPMMVSKWPDKNFDLPPWYCVECRNKVARDA